MTSEAIATSTRLIDRLEQEPALISCAGQGLEWLPTLRHALMLGATPAAVFSAAQEILAPVEAQLAPALPAGFDPLAWVDLAADQLPVDPAAPAVSVPGIVLSQLATLDILQSQGLDISGCTAVGHSQGELTAAVVRGEVPAATALAIAQLIGAATITGGVMIAVHDSTAEAVSALAQEPAVVGLVNSRRNQVLCTTATGAAALRARIAAADISATELKVTAAFHHPSQEAALSQVLRWAEELGLDRDLVERLARAVLTDRIDWPATVRAAVATATEQHPAGTAPRWIFDIGPAAGVAALTRQSVAGRGIGVLNIGTAAGQRELFDAGGPQAPQSWQRFAPQLGPDGQVLTAFSRATGYSPIMLPGMTPTTVDPAIVAAAANAGFWAELAGGGQTTAEILHENIERLSQLLEPGIEAQFNAMYLSPTQWRMQIAGKRRVLVARENGAPINGVVCSAGIPPLEEALSLVEQLHAAHIPWVAFKPGNTRQIAQVLEIADALHRRGDTAALPLIIQIEGGVAGGHHSWENLDDLLLASYADIRERDNVVVAVGGGIGTPERAVDYLSGRWALAYDMPAMPVDAVMVGTAAMAALESTASQSVKQALVRTAGVHDGGWIAAGTARGGMASGRSQLGADIHEIDNSFAKAGRLLDEVAGNAELVAQRREEIIAAINRTAKPYFGDIEQLTYQQWLLRYLELSYLGRWRDRSWAARFAQLLERTEARLNPVDSGPFTAQLAAYEPEADPYAAVEQLVAAYPAAQHHTVGASDRAWFIALLREPGKPANFVPVIDGEIRRWWRADSLWQAHDEHWDADQVCIIPGTVAVAGITEANEPIAQLLRRFDTAVAQYLRSQAPAQPAASADDAPAATTAAQRLRQARSLSWAGRWRTPLLSPAAQLTEQADHQVQVDIDLAGAIAPDTTLSVTVELPQHRWAQPVVSATAAAAAMRELARVAAGGTLGTPVATDGLAAARWQAQLTAQRVFLDGPDKFVGLSWPAVFGALSQLDAVEGLLSLVHLNHSFRAATTSTSTGAAADVVTGAPEVALGSTIDSLATVTAVTDTPIGRVIDVTVDLWVRSTDQDEQRHLGTLVEQFAIRGRRGHEDIPPARTALDQPTAVARPASFRHQRTVVAPQSMRSFALITGDHNPIHVSDTAAQLAGLPGVIVHGMWTSAQAQAAASFDGLDILHWSISLLAPVLPGAAVEFSVERSGIDSKNGEIRSIIASVAGQPVATATATMAAPRTFYGFPGQGIQSQGMGMAAYAQSAAARDIWERADRHTRQALGFSILEVVRSNPKRLRVGAEEFSHPQGVLYLTQFTQVAMATLGCAQVAQLKEAGVFRPGAYFAGHSVGEYNALAAYAEVFSLEALVEIVYRRGLTMHRLVPRDEQGNSNYALAALRPNKMGLNAAEVFDFVAEVARSSGEFLEIVNYNIAGVQYAVAGTRAGLAAIEAAAASRAPGERALIMIPGIDVPFHSSRLLGGVPDFREHLDQLIPQDIDLEVLHGRYIPNLVARPFELSEDFTQAIAQVVDSAPIAEILQDYSAAAADPQRLARTLLVELLAWQFASPVRWIETQDLVLRTLGIEHFVEIGVGTAPTLANMLGQTLRLEPYLGHPIAISNIERDAAVVFATDTVAAPADTAAADAATADAAADAAAAEAASPATAEVAAPAPTSPATPASADPAPPTAAAGGTPEDLPLQAGEATLMLVALWTKVRPDQIGPADSIEALVEGVSSRRNQLLLDLGTEFGLGAIDGAADAEMTALQATVAAQARTYRAFGPVLAEQVADSLRRLSGPAAKKPGYIAQRISQVWGLGPGWVDRITAELVLGTRDGASLRGGQLATLATEISSAADLDAVIDAAVAAAGRSAGVSIALPSAAGSGSGNSAAVVDLAALSALQESLSATARDLIDRLAALSPAAEDSLDAELADTEQVAALSEAIAAELGPSWQQTVTPIFDPRTAVLLDDRWASAREDLAAGVDSDFSGLGEDVAVMAEYLGQDCAAAQARIPATELDHDGDIALVTGASPRSIAAAVVAQLVHQGATVIATTSRLDQERLEFYKQLYREHARGAAALWVVPANLNSFRDCDALMEWIGQDYSQTVGGSSVLIKEAMVLDLLFPFAAPRVAGTVADTGPAAEMQMRLLLWSVERLIALAAAHGTHTHIGHRVHIVLPGSPNRGRFGGDGAYGESKAALDALVNRWHAEAVWAQRTSLVHAQIGWVRGTGLMGGNDPLVAAVEAQGVRTYSTAEMAAALLELASASTRSAAAKAPVLADLSGGLALAELNLPQLAAEAAADAAEAAARAAHAAGNDGEAAPRQLAALPNPRTAMAWTSPDFSSVSHSLDEMVVIVGGGELGPLGSSRTRYEMEISGQLSAAGIIELAWSTGLIRWDNGWLSAEGEPLAEAEIASRYEQDVLARIGVRRFHDDFGPHSPMVNNLAPELTTIYLDQELSFSVPDEATARSFELEGAVIKPLGQEWQVIRPAGSAIRVPRRVAMSRVVGGQIPTGFDPAVYGIPADMLDNLDRVALWNLVCTVDAFLSAGFSPAELLSQVHPARVSSTQGTGMGAMAALRSLYVDKLLAEPRPNDILQEALPNVVAAHVMQSYIGGYGQMIHPVAACATAAVSVEEAVDKLQLGKADFVIAGGIDDLSIEGITGFGDMAATADSAQMAAKGIAERYYSRANDRRRGGFVESAGGGTLVLTTGRWAARLGLPVLAVVPYAESFADGAHTSIPAPGIGALSAARGGSSSRLARALAQVGVGADDIAVLSKHDTSTNANDPNESDLHERIAHALGRSAGNPLYVISQKTLTGHAKGGAAAFQIMGLSQVLREGIIPPNRSLDCVDPVLRQHSHLTWLRRPLDLQARPPKAGLVTSLGFGHVSALVAVVHPGAFLAALHAEDPEAAQRWSHQARQRELAGLRRLDAAIHGGPALYQRPQERHLGSGQSKEREAAVLLSEHSRLVDGLLEP